MTTPADDPPPSTGYLIWHVSLTWRAAVDRALASLGLTSAQYALLASLYAFSRAGARPSQRELADFSGLEPMFVSRLARALERARLVERDANRADPRAFQLTVTERGAEVVLAAAAIVRELEEQRLAPLGGRLSERSAELRATLQALLRYARAMEAAREDAAQRQKRLRTRERDHR